MDIKIKTLYSDRVKPTELVSIKDSNNTEEEIIAIVSEVIKQIIDDDNTMVGLYISRE